MDNGSQASASKWKTIRWRYIVICIGLPSSCSHEYLINLCKVKWFQYEELRKPCPSIFFSLVVRAVKEVERQVQNPLSSRGNWTWMFQSLVGILNTILLVRKKSHLCFLFLSELMGRPAKMLIILKDHHRVWLIQSLLENIWFQDELWKKWSKWCDNKMAYHKGAYSHLCYLLSTQMVYPSLMTEKIKVVRIQLSNSRCSPDESHVNINTHQISEYHLKN